MVIFTLNQLTIVLSDSHLTYIEYLSVLMREVNICVDEELVLKMLSFVDVLIEGMQEKSPTEIEEV